MLQDARHIRRITVITALVMKYTKTTYYKLKANSIFELFKLVNTLAYWANNSSKLSSGVDSEAGPTFIYLYKS